MAKIHRNDETYLAQQQQNAATRSIPKLDHLPEPKEEPAEEGPTEAERPVKEKKKATTSQGGRAYTVAMVLCLVVFLFSGGMLLKRLWEDRQAENEFADLQAMIDTTAAPATGEDGTGTNSAKFAALRDQNPDFIGWLSIPDTNLDFPVMYAPNNKDFYLRHDFSREYSVYGVPYLDEKTTLGANDQSENLVIYGHNMKTGTIFGCLTGYKKAEYYTEHPTITFDTVYGDGTYEVFAAFSIDVVADQSFVYNEYVDLDEATYNAYVDEVIARSDVDTGIRPSYGDQLLTLSTCEYSSDNGRYVVVARRVNT